MLYPAFLARNRIVTRVLAETTKVKNNFINRKRKSSKENSVVFLVEGEEFKLRICLRGVGSAANSVGTTLEHTAFAAFLTPSPGELAPCFVFFCPQPWFLWRSEHISQENARVYRNTVTCVTRVTSNRVKVHRLNSQHLAMGHRTSAFRYFLSTTMVFSVVQHIYSKKNTCVYFN